MTILNEICKKVARSHMKIGDVVEMVWDRQMYPDLHTAWDEVKVGDNGRVTGFHHRSDQYINIDGGFHGYSANRFKIIKRS